MISILIPAYNEAQNIKETVDELIETVKQTKYSGGCEIIVVDDHSEDSTYQQVASIEAPNVHCVRLSRRSGSHVALRAGINQANGEAVICISADGQDNPSVLDEMLQKWNEGAHVVWALRDNRNDAFEVKNIAMIAFYKILKLLTNGEANRVELSRADYFLLDKKVVAAINSCKESNTSLFGLIAWLGFIQTHVEYRRRDRRSGKSKWSFARRLNLAVDWIVAFSSVPLKLTALVGVFVTLLGFLYALFTIIASMMFGASFGVWHALLVAVLVLGGIQIAVLGILGEYLWRSMYESKNRPLYFLEKSTAATGGEVEGIQSRSSK